MGKTFTYIISAIVLLGAIFSLGWWLGSSRKEVEVREKVRYVERPATKIDFNFAMLEQLARLDLPKMQYHDTTYITLRERIPADTGAIIADYLKRRAYELDFSTDTTGVFKVDAIVEANRLVYASATIQPLQREVENTVVKVRKFRPFVSGGVAIGTNVGATLGVGGIIKDKHIVSAKYTRYGAHDIYGAEYGYIFGK